MNAPMNAHCRLLLAGALLTGWAVQVQADNCAAMEASGPEWFAAQLTKAEGARQRGDSQEAYDTLYRALTGLPRRADVSLDARCVGLALWQRFYDLRRQLTLALGQQAEAEGRSRGSQGALDWYVQGDNREDAQRVIRELTKTSQGTGWAIGRLRGEIGMLDGQAERGFDLLPEEQAARDFWQTGLDGLAALARQQGQKLLAQEVKILTRDATASELQLEEAQQSTRSMVAQFYGDESLLEENEAQRELNRAKISLRVLGDARGWFQAVSFAEAAPARERALVRGDALVAQAGDAALSLEGRDSLYAAADDYFEFAQDRERRLAVERARAAIAPALRTERDERSARLEKKQAELEASARQAEQAMQKTEAEKASFKKEADALEDELGF